ncbi:MAG: amidohydrolase family protein [Alphaproteobacteria bacterium]|nr:amidohydrolase family protein [Alphaproteobacteria bacterium]
MLRAAIIALFVLLTATTAIADTIAITNARIHTMARAGDIANGTIIVRNGRIDSVGTRIRVPANATVIDAKGGEVTPGFFVVGTDLGALEVDLVKQTQDNATANSSLSAAFDISYGIDPDSVAIPIARLGGVTRALVTPVYADADGRELLFAGQAAVITLAEGRSAVKRTRAAMVLELGEGGAARAGGARGSAITALRADLDDVRWYAARRGSFNSGATRELRFSKADLDALVPVVRGRMPLIVGVHRAADIREVLKLARDYRLKIVLAGAEEGWMVADEIARARVPVMLNPTANLPASFEARGATMENAARLHAAGVTITFANGDGGHRARESRYNAGNAVAHGLPHGAALAALTINPARIFGERQIGSIERGKQADIVVWDGDPLEPRSQATTILIGGVAQPMTSRGEDLARRYRTLGSPYPPAYRD